MQLLTASAADVHRAEAVRTLAAFRRRRTSDVVAREAIRCTIKQLSIDSRRI